MLFVTKNILNFFSIVYPFKVSSVNEDQVLNIICRIFQVSFNGRNAGAGLKLEDLEQVGQENEKSELVRNIE